jgi:hypothetical protein
MRRISSSEATVSQNVSDDLMNLIEVAVSDNQGNLFGVLFANKHSRSVPGSDGKLQDRRSFAVKVKILEQVFGWEVLVLDEKEFNSLAADKTVRQQYILDLMGRD